MAPNRHDNMRDLADFTHPVSTSYADLPAQFYARVQPQPLTNPRLLHVHAPVAQCLGISAHAMHSQDLLAVCSGQRPLVAGGTVAAIYSGHQFGVWAGQLGDGRAHLLGDIATDQGPMQLQLKGSGKTPYARMGDGRAVLRSSVREYLAAEAMTGLAIPTTRSLALVVSDDPVYRETVETAAIVARVSPSFVRFGSFEHWAKDPDSLRILLDHVVDQDYPECRTDDDDTAQTALRFLTQVTERTARLIADWQTVGFCHGVMNTDNMSILGLTLDYGPYGFMDGFDAGHVCNHSDHEGRYAWHCQPAVAHWNLTRLAGALRGLNVQTEDLKTCLANFAPVFLQRYHANAQAKFGLLQWHAKDATLLDDWWQLLHANRADQTLSFRHLAQAPETPALFLDLFADRRAAQTWLDRYLQRLDQEGRPTQERVAAMNAVNPLYVLRNHLAEQAIEAAKQGDASEITTLLRLLANPYRTVPGHDAYADPAPDWAASLHISCSS